MPITQEQTAASIWFAAAKCQSFCHRWVAIMAARLVRWEMYSENQYHLDGNESGMLQRMPLNDQDATKKYTKWLTRKNRVSNSYWNKDITTLLAGLLGVMGDLNPSTTNMFMGYWLSLFVWDIIHPSNTGPTCLMDFRRHSLYQGNARAVFILVQATKWIRNFLWHYIRPVVLWPYIRPVGSVLYIGHISFLPSPRYRHMIVWLYHGPNYKKKYTRCYNLIL